MIKRSYVYRACVIAFLLAAGWSQGTAQSSQEPVRMSVDLREAAQHIFHAKLSFPVKPGPLTLVYPKWIQGEHSPTGPIIDLTGLKMSAAGKEVAWRRDDVDMFAFHVNVPEGASTLEVSLDYLSPAEASGSRERPASTAKIAVLNWYVVTLYPHGAEDGRFDVHGEFAIARGMEIRDGAAGCER